MTRAAWYPPADRSQDRSEFSGIDMPRISKVLLHSTETKGWPGYPNFAPQFTLDPWLEQVRQHMALPRSASTLADPSWTQIRENRDDIVQIEIIGYCDPQRYAEHGHNVEQMTAGGLELLGRLLAWLHDEWDVPLSHSVTWVHYPASYGLNAAQRLTESRFDAYTGVLGHQHAVGNSHGDPGLIPIDRILATAKRLADVATPTITINGKDYDDIAAVKVSSINSARDRGALSRHVWYVQQWLDLALDEDFAHSAAHPDRGGYWDASTQAAYNAFRRQIGISGDHAVGAVGFGSLDRLRRAAGASKPVAA